jgi:membrane protein DedA with SNARE-associated domain
VILPLAGFRARTGAMNPVLVWLAATLGALAGALILYALGAWLGYDRLYRLSRRPWFILSSPGDLERGRRLFERHGNWVVALSRCVPVLRSVVSLPAGVARMPLARFSVLTSVGAGVWNAIFIGAGWVLADNWRRVEQYSAPVVTVVAVVLIVGLVMLVVRRVREYREEGGQGAGRARRTVGDRR